MGITIAQCIDIVDASKPGVLRRIAKILLRPVPYPAMDVAILSCSPGWCQRANYPCTCSKNMCAG